MSVSPPPTRICFSLTLTFHYKCIIHMQWNGSLDFLIGASKSFFSLGFSTALIRDLLSASSFPRKSLVREQNEEHSGEGRAQKGQAWQAAGAFHSCLPTHSFSPSVTITGNAWMRRTRDEDMTHCHVLPLCSATALSPQRSFIHSLAILKLAWLFNGNCKDN